MKLSSFLSAALAVAVVLLTLILLVVGGLVDLAPPLLGFVIVASVLSVLAVTALGLGSLRLTNQSNQKSRRRSVPTITDVFSERIATHRTGEHLVRHDTEQHSVSGDSFSAFLLALWRRTLWRAVVRTCGHMVRGPAITTSGVSSAA